MKPSELLIAAKVKIANESAWTQRAAARSSDGAHVAVDSPEACRFCAIGSLASVNSTQDVFNVFRTHAALYLDQIAQKRGYRSAPNLNDSADHAAVMSMFEDAIKLAQKVEST